MINKVLFWIGLAIIGTNVNSQNFYIDYQLCYGGSNSEGARKIELVENGFTLFCGTRSIDGDVSINHGGSDYWLIKTDINGNIQWEKTYGGSDDDLAKDMIKSPDYGYVMLGLTFSDDGDVSGFNGGADYWAVKTDSLGNIEWQKCMGGSIGEYACQIISTPDSGYICIGYTASSDGDVSGFHGFYDAWVVKLSVEGEIEWTKCYGGSHIDYGVCITSTTDGGYIFGGLTMSSDGDVLCELSSQYSDSWIVKIDSLGNIEWQQCYGGSFYDNVIDIKQTEDEGYLFLGSTNSNDGDVSGLHGSPGTNFNDDFWIVKLDNTGNIEWQNCLGGSNQEWPRFVEIMEDGGYIVGGATNSFDGDVYGNHSLPSKNDIWLAKLSNDGNIEWQQCFGGNSSENIGNIIIYSNDEFLVSGGTTTSNGSGNVNCDLFAPGVPSDSDVWLFYIKDTLTKVTDHETKFDFLKVYPNPAKDFVKFEVGEINEIQVVNTFGQQVALLEVKNEKVVWDTQKINPGVYFYIFELNGLVKAGKLIISK